MVVAFLRFAEISRRLAGYSATNGTGGLTIEYQREGQWSIKVEHPSEEAFAGTSASFRQLHSACEEASYDKVKGILFKSAKRVPSDEMVRFQK